MLRPGRWKSSGGSASPKRCATPVCLSDYPHDVSYRTTFTGQELTRIPIPCRRDRFTDTTGPDGNWPTPEPPHRINQIFLEPILFAHAESQPRIQILNRTVVEDIEIADDTRDGDAPRSRKRDHASSGIPLRGRVRRARSVVRKAIGAKLHGDAVIQRVQSTYIRAPDLIDRQRHAPAWGTGVYQSAPRRHGLCDRRTRTMAHTQLSETRRAGFRFRRSRLGYPDNSRRRNGFQLRDHFERGLVRPQAGGRQVSRPMRLHRRRCGSHLGSLCRLRHERRHRRCDKSFLAACRPSQRLGAVSHSRRLRGRTFADHRSGFAVRHDACRGRNPQT